MQEELENVEVEQKESVDVQEEVKGKKKRTKKSKSLQQEYDNTFDDEEKMIHKLTSIKSELKIELREIDIESIIVSNFKKVSRTKTLTGLSGIVDEWGVVSPIHVLALEDEDCYQLLEGLRRVFAAAKSGCKTIKALVWDFSDKSEGKEMANILSLMINRTQKYDPTEMWEQMKLLETMNDATPGLIEYLLQMESGQAMKLKDVMLAEDEYEEAKQGLISGKYDIESAYKKLCAMRKKENKLEKEDTMSVDAEGLKQAPIDSVEGNEGDTSEKDSEGENTEGTPKVKLSNDDVKELLDMSDKTDTDKTDLESLDKTAEIRGNVVQNTKHRTYIDPVVKQNTLIRDNFKCRCCGLDGKSGMYLGVLVYHHAIPVYCGGPDTVENGLTLCANCHLTLHNYLMGKVQVDKEKLTDREKEIYANIFKFGNIALEAQKKAGLSTKKAAELDAPSRQHMMPGVGVAENVEALKKAEEEGKVVEEKSENAEGSEKEVIE